MKTIIENVISTGNFDLNDMLKKIDTIWVQGDLTDEERTALIAMAQEKAKPENTYAPLQDQIDKAFEKINELANTVNTNVQKISALKDAVEELGTSVVMPEPEPGEEWPQFVQPQGAHDAYYNGDKVTFEGAHYICIAPEGTACVWSPAAYPTYWQKQG